MVSGILVHGTVRAWGVSHGATSHQGEASPTQRVTGLVLLHLSTGYSPV